MKKILITGANGFIEKLLLKNYQKTILLTLIVEN